MFKWLIILIFSINAQAQNINRNILVLWDSAEHETADFELTPTHSKLEVILNHFGLIAEYLDINEPINKKYFLTSHIKNYRGVISWFLEPGARDPDELIRFHLKWQSLKKKTIILGQFGFLSNFKSQNTPINKVNKLLKGWNISITDKEFKNPLVLEISKKSPQMGFERELKNELISLMHVKSLNKKNKSHLSIKNKVNDLTTQAVLENKYFFYAQNGYELYKSNYNTVTQWRIDPYYLVQWLIDYNFPIPDTTTLYGKRIMYSHIDGDAFISISEVDRKSLCGEIIRKEIIDKFKIPISASLVMAEVDPKYRGNKRIFKIAQEFYNSPYIEPASHTYFHPLSWNKKPGAFDIEIYFGKKKKEYIGGPIVAYKYPDYFELDYNKEILESLKYLNKVILKNKSTNLLFWSGSCRPPKEALKLISQNSILNINGGDSRFDRRFNSVSHVYPLGKRLGKHLQVYSSNSNENTYTNLWEGPFVGFRDVIETFKNTEKPHRIKPINIYYHFYSGEKISSLKALKDIYEWTLDQDVLPIFTSRFVKIAQNFYDIKVQRVSRDNFKIYNINNLRTLRYKGIYYPDYKRSKNIIGHKHINGSTYIHLNNKSQANLRISKSPKTSTSTYIVDSDGFIENFYTNKNKTTFDFKSDYGTTFKVHSEKYKFKSQKNIKSIKYEGKTAFINLISKNEKVILEVVK